MEAKRKNI